MVLIDLLLVPGFLRKLVWKCWYPILTRRLAGEEVLFLNYAYETDPPMGLPLAPGDEPNRACIQLYHAVAAQVDLHGQRVLEVSCGHGGGASYLTRTFKPAAYTGLDLNPAGIGFCAKRHAVPGLDFIQGDAERLPFADAAFDVVINVEASHCYPRFPRFLAEVTRVLNGGHFLYADFRFRDHWEAWGAALAGCGLDMLAQCTINTEVLRGMEANSERSADLVRRHLPKFMHGTGRDFAGVRSSRVHADLARGEMAYRVFRLRKPTAKR